jgi:transposase
MSLWLKRMEKEQQEINEKEFKKQVKGKPKVLQHNEIKSSKLIKLLPNPLQKEKMKQFFGSYRFIYNKCVELNVPYKNQKQVLRDLLVKQDALYTNAPETRWLKDVPMELKDAAMLDFCKAIHSNLAKKKIDPTFEFKLQFKSRRAPSQSIQLRTRDIMRKNGHLVPFPTFWKKGNEKLREIRSSEPVAFSDQATRIVYKRQLSSYYTSVSKTNTCDNQASKLPFDIVALDPGVKCFHNSFSLLGHFSFYGYESRETTNQLHNRIDALKSDLVLLKKQGMRKKVQNRKRKMAHLHKRIKDLVTTMHYLVIKDLVTRFPIILLPEFATKQMLSKKKNLNKKSKREMATLSHYTFKQRLLHKCKWNGNKLFIINEAYSTKTCFNCDFRNQKIKGRWFICANCGHQDHRDINPCKNMLKWYLPKLSTLG